MKQPRLQLQVDVQVNLGRRGDDACLIQECAQAFVLLRGEKDGRPIAPRREPRERPRLAD